MKIEKRIIYIVILVLTATSCANNSKNHVSTDEKKIHDEFNVISNPPLSFPPLNELDSVYSNEYNTKLNFKNKEKLNEDPTYGEKLLLKKISLNDETIKAIIYKKDNSISKGNFFGKIFSKKNNYSKDSTQDPRADEEDRTYKSKSLQYMKTDNSISTKKICNIHNGEIIYCDKNTFMKNFSFPTK